MPNIKINGKAIRYVTSSKVLGLIIDEELSFKEHALLKLKQCKQKWGLLTRATNRYQGLNTRSLTLLVKTIVLTKLLYAAPIWLNKQINKFSGFWNSVILKCSGATLNPHRDLTEMILQLPPLEVQLEKLTLKFLCKSMTQQDFMSSIIVQVDNTKSHMLKAPVKTLKDFIATKLGTRTSRNIDLLDENVHELYHYNKHEIEQFMFKRWLNMIKNRCLLGRKSSDKDRVLLELVNEFQLSDTELTRKYQKNIFIFNNGTTKRSDSYICDFIHGNSVIFGNIRKSVYKGESDMCQFCLEHQDSPVHQLFYCEQLKDNTVDALISEINCIECYQKEVLFPKDKEVQLAFIRRVAYLEEKHESS